MSDRRAALSLVVSLILALSLAACGRNTTLPTPTTPTPRETSGTVEGWTDGEAVVKAESFSSETGEQVVLAEGTISADGSFSLTLPVGEEVPEAAFSTVNEADICPTEQGVVNTIEITPSGPFDWASFSPPFAVYDSTGSDYLGNIYLSDDSFATFYAYAYVASDVTVTGECVITSSGSGGDSPYTIRYDLDLKAGWNGLFGTFDEETGSTTSTGSIPAGISWLYDEALDPTPCDPDELECLPEPPVTPVE